MGLLHMGRVEEARSLANQGLDLMPGWRIRVLTVDRVHVQNRCEPRRGRATSGRAGVVRLWSRSVGVARWSAIDAAIRND